MPLPPNANYYKLVSHKTIANALRTARTAKSLSAKEAGERVGLAQAQLSRIECGKQAFFTDGVKAKLDELAKNLDMPALKWVEADWRATERGPKPKQVTTPVQALVARTVSVPPTVLDSRASVVTLLDLYDAGILDRTVVVDALTNLTKES